MSYPKSQMMVVEDNILCILALCKKLFFKILFEELHSNTINICPCGSKYKDINCLK